MGRLRIGMAAGTVLAGIGGSGSALAQENKFTLSAQVVGAYDSNTLRLGSTRTTLPTDNSSLNPQAAIDYSRRFGRQRVFLAGTAGYVFNSRFSFLDRENINLSGGANLRAGARCEANPSFSLFRAQSDLEDLGGTIRNTYTAQSYSAEVSCPRSVGLYPKVSGGFAKTNNSGRRKERNQNTFGGRISLVYAKPSLGGLEAYVEYTKIERNNRQDFFGNSIIDSTEITTYGLRYQRSVGTLITLDANAGLTHANPQSSTIPSFSGLTYASTLSYQRSSAGSLRVGFSRTVSARNNLGTSYYVSREVFAGINLRATSKIGVGAQVEYGTRQYRGEDSGFRPLGPRGDDKSINLTANASYRLNQKISLSLLGRYRERNAENRAYDYSASQVALTASVRL